MYLYLANQKLQLFAIDFILLPKPALVLIVSANCFCVCLCRKNRNDLIEPDFGSTSGKTLTRV